MEKDVENERIDKMIDAIMKLARGDYSVQVELTGKNDKLDSLAMGINMMIDDIKNGMEKLEQKAKSLEKTRLKLADATMQLMQSDKLSALGELTAGIAHELKQPLNGIKIICQSIMRDIEKNRFASNELPEELEDIVKQVDKMSSIIDHIRVFTRSSIGNNKQMVNLNTIINNVFAYQEQQFKNQNIEIIFNLDSKLPKVEVDPLRLEQVFLNLIINARNALKKTPKSRKYLKIKSHKDDVLKQVIVEITDNGNGISPHIKDKIFKPFFTTKEPGEGTGLGLSIVRKIVDEYSGKVEVQSIAKKNTTFRVILPMKKEYRKDQ